MRNELQTSPILETNVRLQKNMGESHGEDARHTNSETGSSMRNTERPRKRWIF